MFFTAMLCNHITQEDRKKFKKRHKDKPLYYNHVDAHGNRKVTGGPGLHESQEHPYKYAEKVVDTYVAYRKRHCKLSSALEEESSDSDYSGEDAEMEDAWEEAEIDTCLQLFRNSDARKLF